MNNEEHKKNTRCRSWFCVLNNPVEHFPEWKDETPENICVKLSELWCVSGTRSGAWVYCISADGLHHVHMVLEDTNKASFSAVKNAYEKAHIEPTQGNKKQVEDYIYKRGAFEEKGEQVIYTHLVGEIKGSQQGRRSDLNMIKEMIEVDGLTPIQVIDTDANFYRYESYINKMYYAKRLKETPFLRDVAVYWHFGKSGTGKSYTTYQYVEEFGRENVYITSASASGGRNPFDGYTAQKYLFIDELRSNSPFFDFATLLSTCDRMTMELQARYQNKIMLWNEVHITTPLMPYEMYDYLDKHDKIDQLYRRIRYYVYHYIDENGQYCQYIYDNGNKRNKVMRDYIVYLAKQENKKSSGTSANAPEGGNWIDEYMSIF